MATTSPNLPKVSILMTRQLLATVLQSSDPGKKKLRHVKPVSNLIIYHCISIFVSLKMIRRKIFELHIPIVG